MRTRFARLAIARPALLGLATLAGFAVQPAEAQRIRHQGYSVQQPVGSAWRLVRRQPAMLAFRRHEAGNPTTVVAFGRVLQARVDGYPGLEAITARLTRSEGADRPSRREVSGARCVFKRFLRASQRGTTVRFMLRGADLFCLHPRTGAVIHLGFSQRYPADDAPVGTGGEMISFFNSLRFH